MSSLCHSIKQEYEALKILNNEFALACEKAGDPRILSDANLRVLQTLKQQLEHARGSIEKKIENNTWKNALGWAMDAVVVSEGDHKEESVALLISEPSFQHHIHDHIHRLLVESLLSSDGAWDVVVGICAWDRAGQVNETDRRWMRELPETQPFQKKLFDYMQKRADNADEWSFVIGLQAIRHMGVLTEGDRLHLYNRVNSESTRNDVQSVILDAVNKAMLAETLDRSHDVWRAIVGLASALDLGLISGQRLVTIQKMMESEAFQKEITSTILEDAVDGLVDGRRALYALRALNALKDLDKHLGRRRKNK